MIELKFLCLTKQHTRKTCRGVKEELYSFITAAVDVRGHVHAPAALLVGKEP
jgi:hypothetical protein